MNYLGSAGLATLPDGLDSNVTQLLANLLTKPSVFYYLPIVPCNLVSIKLLLLLILLFILISNQTIEDIKLIIKCGSLKILIQREY